jgi:hypothetical protein
MRNRPTGFWQALEAVPGAAAVDAEWKARFGNDYGTAKAFLRPNGKLASSHPCLVQRGCGCEHEVVVHDPEDIVAVCRCERGCETFTLQRSDIVVYELDRRVLDAALAKVFGLFEETDSATDLPGTTRIGVYSPYAGYRFPVYLTIQIEPDDFSEVLDGLLGRNEAPFLLLAPTRGLCTAKAEKRLTDKRSGMVSLSENVGIEAKRQFQLLHPMDDILAQFHGFNLPQPKEDGATAFFPTPPDASWGEVSIRFKDGHTVSIKAKSAGGVFNYTQMGMANKKNGNPTVQWELLKTFADERGILDWSSNKAHRHNQKRRELLAANLRDFFRIEGDPFHLTDDGKGWQARFLISPDE